ncbi:MAG: hypothetical protein DRO08_02825, partial [Thermoprotei archaeon]
MITAILIAITQDPVLSTKIIAALTYTLVSLAIYLFTVTILKDKKLAIPALVLASIQPALQYHFIHGTYNIILCIAIYIIYITLIADIQKPIKGLRYVLLFLLTITSPLASLELAQLLMITLAISIIYFWTRDREKSVTLIFYLVSLVSIYLYYGAWVAYNPPVLQYPLKPSYEPLDILGGPFIISFQAILTFIYLFTLIYFKKYVKLAQMIIVATPLLLVLNTYHPLLLSLIILLTTPISLTLVRYIKGQIIGLKKTKEDDETIIEIEVSLDKITLIVLLIILIPTIITQAATIAKQYDASDVEDIKDYIPKITSWINGNLTDKDRLAAPPAIIKWLEIYSNKRLVPENTREYYEALDIVTSTTYRIETPYLRLDDWQPYSVARTPLIYAWNKREYIPIL